MIHLRCGSSPESAPKDAASFQSGDASGPCKLSAIINGKDSYEQPEVRIALPLGQPVTILFINSANTNRPSIVARSPQETFAVMPGNCFSGSGFGETGDVSYCPLTQHKGNFEEMSGWEVSSNGLTGDVIVRVSTRGDDASECSAIVTIKAE